ncbi:hypothetical protein ZIOFF_042121 [Zingiber officinale]|uniref:chitinase n=1 Tax=Zingiber officinale TaxID=94328 RepID=A0A8J5GJU4_ZINOF|nr:hypothetical protein ZIOFF_042121 [Zingiber officinale]
MVRTHGGYCFHREQGSPPDYCVPSAKWPCASGEKYYGQGPMQISYNYNYGAAGEAIGVDLLSHPDLVATDPVISFQTAIWFWMTPQSPKPSPHDVMVGRWQPENRDRYLALDVTISLKKASWLRMTPQSSRPPSSSSDDIIIGRWQPADRDVEAGEIAGYGVITEIIDGGVECGKGIVEPGSRDRIGYYKRYCDILGVSYGDNLDCNNQTLFGR